MIRCLLGHMTEERRTTPQKWERVPVKFSLWSSPALCPQSLVISCTVSAFSGHLLYCVRSLWSSPVLCPQSLVISCTVSAVSGHLLHCVRSLWSSPVLCLQSIGSEYFFFFFRL
ncbi:unnamed protein product [Staurois parvus]|uniref:Uncharacterized protein n=1 Tax=Staurois parvus TaxID=386267 RepID=A0ABN9H6L2_9NEOB|nr:unnamed protein product [Staurois parvus]